MKLPEDLERFLKEEKWFYAPDDKSIRTAVTQWCDGKRLKENGHIGAWNTSKVTNMSCLFYNKIDFNDIIIAWDVSNVTNMRHLFCRALSFNQPLVAWNVSNVTDMSFMFRDAIVFNQPLATWNVSKVTNMSYMFYDAISFKCPINKWNVSNVEYMECIFDGCPYQIPGRWYTAKWEKTRITNLFFGPDTRAISRFIRQNP